MVMPDLRDLVFGASILIGIICAFMLLAVPAPAQQPATVIDGDTVRVGGESVRIIGLDAPEMQSRCLREWRMARAATARLGELVAAGVVLEPQGRDRYRRLLAVVRDSRGRDVAQVLIAERLARPYNGRTRRQSWC